MKTIATCPGRYQEAIDKLTTEEKSRAAYKCTGVFGENVTIQIFNNRQSMLKTVEMQDIGICSKPSRWIAIDKAVANGL